MMGEGVLSRRVDDDCSCGGCAAVAEREKKGCFLVVGVAIGCCVVVDSLFGGGAKVGGCVVVFDCCCAVEGFNSDIGG